MSPRLSATVKRNVRKKHADFGPFLVAFRFALRVVPMRRTLGVRRKGHPSYTLDIAAHERRAARSRRRFAIAVASRNFGRGCRSATVSRKKLNEGDRSRGDGPRSCTPRPDDLGRLTAENPWSHDEPLGEEQNRMILLAKSQAATSVS